MVEQVNEGDERIRLEWRSSEMAEQKKVKGSSSGPCETCVNYVYDEEYECYCCDVNLDEDDMYRFLTGDCNHCAYYQLYDEYKVVRKQM